MRENIYEYMNRTREDRRSKLVLSEPCLEVEGACSSHAKGLLALHYNTTVPRGKLVHVCHACHNPTCLNVNHLYWGTNKDNYTDQVENGTASLSIYQKGVQKYGKEKWHEMMREQQIRATRKRSERPKVSYEHYRERFSQVKRVRGWVTRMAEELGVSHTHVKRIDNWLKSL